MRKKSKSRIPVSEEVCKRFYGNGVVDGIGSALHILMWVCVDKRRWPPEELQKLGNQINQLSYLTEAGMVDFGQEAKEFADSGVILYRKLRNCPVKASYTYADAERWYRIGIEDSMYFCTGSVLSILKNQHGFSNDQLREFKEQLGDVRSSIRLGYISMKDIIETLESEFGWEVEA